MPRHHIWKVLARFLLTSSLSCFHLGPNSLTPSQSQSKRKCCVVPHALEREDLQVTMQSNGRSCNVIPCGPRNNTHLNMQTILYVKNVFFYVLI
jgi:hypothetical protein